MTKMQASPGDPGADGRNLGMKKSLAFFAGFLLVAPVLTGVASGQNRERDAGLIQRLHEIKYGEPDGEVVRGDPGGGAGDTAAVGAFSKQQINAFRSGSSR